MKQHIPVTSTTCAPKLFCYLGYGLLCLEQIHLVLIFDSPEAIPYHLSLTPSEYTIFLQFLRYPAQQTVPFQELVPTLNQHVPLQDFLAPLRQHISRLKKKLPPYWKITCEGGFGYRLRVIRPSDESDNLRSERGQAYLSPSTEKEV